MRAVLQNQTGRKLLLTLAGVGWSQGVFLFLLPWLVLQQTHSAPLTAISVGAVALPLLFCLVPAGHAFDYQDRRRLAIVFSTVSLTVSAVACLGFLLQVLPLSAFFVLVCVNMLMSGLMNVTTAGAVMLVYPPGMVATAVGLQTTIRQIEAFAAPALGAFMFSLLGAAGATSSAVIMGLVAVYNAWKIAGPVRTQHVQPRLTFTESLRALKQVPHLLAIFGFSICLNVAASQMFGIQLPFLHQQGGISSLGVALVITGGAVGSLGAIWLTHHIGKGSLAHQFRRIAQLLCGWSIAAVVYILTTLWVGAPGAAVSWGLLMFCNTTIVSLLISARIEQTPLQVQSASAGVGALVNTGSFTTMILVSGAVATVLPLTTQNILGVGLMLMVAAGFFGYSVRLRRQERQSSLPLTVVAR